MIGTYRGLRIGLLTLLLVALLAGTAATAVPNQVYYASPNGSGSQCTITTPCSLTGARDKIRTINTGMASDIIVYLRGGTYTLTETFALTAADSGLNGHSVIYQAYPGETVVISGGRAIFGWSLYDTTKNIYRSHVGDLNTRQLYVNGGKATRARGESAPAGFVKTASGYKLPGSGLYSNMAFWQNPSDIEIVGFNQWKSFRCGVASIAGSDVSMDQPCWNNANNGDVKIGLPEWIENAYELLDSPGEWYYNRALGDIFYIPRAGDNIASAYAVAPVLETLVSGTGTPDSPIHDIQFKGLIFAYATWLRPSTTEGYVPTQAANLLNGTNLSTVKTPGNVDFKGAANIVFERNVFSSLGAAALSFDIGSRDNTIVGNKIYNVSSHGIEIGNVMDRGATGSAIVRNNTVKNNYIFQIGTDYHDGVGIFVGFTDGTVIDHNEIFNVPYSGVSVGWGWTDAYTPSLQNNKITNNYIHDFMSTLMDGGGIYTLSRQDNSLISGNHVQNNQNEYGSIYLDQGSTYFTVTSNVVDNNFSNWIFVQDSAPPYSHDNTIVYNYTDTTRYRIYANNSYRYNTVVLNGSWPLAAQSIMNRAGLEPAYSDLK